MKFLLWEIKYIGLGTSPTLNRFNRRLIRDAIKAGESVTPTYGHKINRVAAVKYVKNATGASLKDSLEFCRKHVFNRVEAGL